MAQQWVVNDRMYLQGEILVSVPNPQKTVPLGFSSHSRAFFVVLRAAATKIRQLVNSLIHTFFAMFQATPSPKTTRDINVESQSPINLSQNSGTSPCSPQKLKVDPIFAPRSTDTAPSRHRRINAPSLLLAFAHVQGEAGTPSGGVGSAVVGRNSPVLCAGGVFFPV
jgi:hypothetical protein